jgi:hypothetical protein
METLSELLEQLPKKGWIKLIRSPTNNNKWWCKYIQAEDSHIFSFDLEAWGDTPEEATKSVLQRIKENL